MLLKDDSFYNETSTLQGGTNEKRILLKMVNNITDGAVIYKEIQESPKKFVETIFVTAL